MIKITTYYEAGEREVQVKKPFPWRPLAYLAILMSCLIAAASCYL